MKHILATLMAVIAVVGAFAQSPDTLRWGIVSLSCVHLRAEASHGSGMETQAVMGTPLQILEQLPEWYKVETPEGYVAWVHTQSVAPKSSKEMNHWRQAQRYIYTAMQGYAYCEPRNNARPISNLVLGCIVEGKKSKRGYIEITTPDGRKGYVHKEEMMKLDDWAVQQPDLNRLVDEASQMMGTTYLWGGTSTQGADCSGYTKLLYYSQGIILQRNASQQALYGEEIDYTQLEKLQQGDLLFFANENGRINHVAIYLDKGRYIHSSGRVKINSMLPNDTLYNHLTVVAARRITTAIGEEGITLVRNHPWYF